jgi:hypothetical protein
MRPRHGKEVLITQSGEGELELRMRDALHLSETSGATTKSNKLVDSTSLGRPPVIPMKCESPVSPSSVAPVVEALSEDIPWNGCLA